MVKDTAKKETVKKTKDRGLGRGLDALFGDEEAQFIEDTNEEVVTTAPRKKVGIGYMTRLLALPASVQVMVEVGDLSMGHARALLATDDCEQLALKVIEGNLSVRATEELVAEYEGKSTGEKFDAVPKEKRVGFSDKDADTLALEKEVSTSLGG